ncbi:MAG: hypothetical protein WD055_05490 [Candidatus Dependentiae bacterium]
MRTKKTLSLLKNKELTNATLKKNDIPTSDGENRSFFSALAFVQQVSFPLVIKPTYGTLSQGAHFPINSWPHFVYAFFASKRYGWHTMVEKYYSGKSYRIVVTQDNMLAAAHRLPANVIGNGKDTIKQLIQQKNKDPRRKPKEIQNTTLHHVIIDNNTTRMLRQQNKTLHSIPAQDEQIFLEQKLLLSRGGDVIDITDQVHPKNKAMFIRTATVLGANLAGIDCIMTDISQPWNEQETGIIDVNGKPYIDMHHFPSQGITRNIAKSIVSLLDDIPSGIYL